MSDRQPKIREYVVGAALANAPVLFLALAISFIDSEIPAFSLSIILFIFIIAGSTLAGFLVAGRTLSNYLVAGLVTGFFAYTIYNAIITIVFRASMWPGTIWVLLGFMSGSLLGSLMRKRQMRR